MENAHFAITDLKHGFEVHEDDTAVCLSAVQSLQLGNAFYSYRLELAISDGGGEWRATVFGRETEIEIDETGEPLSVTVQPVPEGGHRLIAVALLRQTDERGVSPRPTVVFSTMDPTRYIEFAPHDIFPDQYAV